MKSTLKVVKALVIGSLAVLLAVQGSIIAASFIGDAFPIIADATLQEVTPSIAYNSQRQEYLVVWSNNRPGNDDIRGVRLTKNGAQIGNPFWISAGSGNERWEPDVTYNSQHNQYLVVWQFYDSTAGNGIKGRRVSATGVVLDTADITIRSAGAPTWNAYTPAVAYAYTSDRYLVVYEQVWAGNFFICGQGVDSNGALVGPTDFTIASNTGEELFAPDVAYNLHVNRFLVVWEESYSTEWDIKGQQVTGDDSLWQTWFHIASSTDIERDPAVAALHNTPTADKFMVAWEQYVLGDWDIYSAVVEEGIPGFSTVSPAIAIATYSANETNPAIAGNNSNLEYFVTWRYDDGGIFAPIRGQSVTYAGNLTGQLAQALPTNSDGDFPAIAAGPVGDFVIAWQDPRGTATFDIYGRLVGNRTYLPLIKH
jgi:hypothetical protein